MLPSSTCAVLWLLQPGDGIPLLSGLVAEGGTLSLEAQVSRAGQAAPVPGAGPAAEVPADPELHMVHRGGRCPPPLSHPACPPSPPPATYPCPQPLTPTPMPQHVYDVVVHATDSSVEVLERCSAVAGRLWVAVGKEATMGVVPGHKVAGLVEMRNSVAMAQEALIATHEVGAWRWLAWRRTAAPSGQPLGMAAGGSCQLTSRRMAAIPPCPLAAPAEPDCGRGGGEACAGGSADLGAGQAATQPVRLGGWEVPVRALPCVWAARCGAQVSHAFCGGIPAAPACLFPWLLQASRAEDLLEQADAPLCGQPDLEDVCRQLVAASFQLAFGAGRPLQLLVGGTAAPGCRATWALVRREQRHCVRAPAGRRRQSA